jgi:hypothetical protein
MPITAQLIGCLTLRNEGDGCLTSKYMNNTIDPGPFTEACKLMPGTGIAATFCGRYKTVWIESGLVDKSAELRISLRLHYPGIYDLEWHNSSGITIFYGTGMLFGELLVATYWMT